MKLGWIALAGLTAAVGTGVYLLIRRGTRIASGQLSGRQHGMRSMPKFYWEEPPPTEEKRCYRRKMDAANMFIDWNDRIIAEAGGVDYADSTGQEFESLTKYEGVRPTTIAEAVWAALPARKKGQYCIDDIDLAALNDMSAVRHNPSGSQFRMPDYVLEEKLLEEEWAHYQRQIEDDGDVPF